MNRALRYEPEVCLHPLKKITKVGDDLYEIICMCCDTNLGVK